MFKFKRIAGVYIWQDIVVSWAPMNSGKTLIMKIVNILTDKAMPIPELVEKVKILYEEKVEDVRFLIPVLTGLSKNEIVQTLPKLIQLSPQVVKEVFVRLLNTVSSGFFPSLFLICFILVYDQSILNSFS